MGQGFRHQDLGGAGSFRYRCNEQSDGTSSYHCHRLPCPQMGQVDCMDCDAQRLQHRALDGPKALWQAEAVLCRHDGVLGKDTVDGRRATETHVGAQVRMSVQAEFALAAGDSRLDADQLPNGQIFHARSQFGNPSRELVPHDDGGGNHLGADATMQVVVHIRTAHADGSYLQQHLPGPGLGTWELVYAQIADAVQSRGAHER